MKRHISIFTFLLCAFAACSLAQRAYSVDFAIIANEQMSIPYFIEEWDQGTYTLNLSVSYPEAYNYWQTPLADSHVLTAESRPGKDFGWYTLANNDTGHLSGNTSPSKCTVLLTDGLSITASQIKTAKTSSDHGSGYVICPKYEYIKFDLVFDGNGATSGSMQNMTGLTIDDEFTLPENSYAKTGHHFAGWKTNVTEGVLFADKASQKGSAFWNGKSFDSKLYAQWAANTYTVTFDKNGGGSPSPASKTVTYNLTYGDLASCSRTGYDFAGWYTEKSGGTKIESTTKVTITADQTLYAHWTANAYTVTVAPNGGTGGSCPNYTVSTAQQTKTVTKPTRTGYSISGWTVTGATGDTPTVTESTLTIPANVSGNLTLTPHWTPVTYTISYSGLKEGSTHSGNPTSYTIESGDITFNSASDTTAYKFNGWSPATLPKGSTGNQTVTASYLAKVDHPVATTPLIYNGSVQSCASSTAQYQATGNQQTVPGQYTATFTLCNGYCWTDGNIGSYSVPWEIQKADLTGVSVGQSGSLTYNGEPQQPQVSAYAIVKGSQTVTWKYSKSPGAYAETMPSFTDAGTYTVYFEASAPNHNSAHGSFQVVIDRAKTAAVSFSNDQLTYTGREQGPDVTFTHCTEAAGSVKKGTDVGTYTVKATPDSNYAWSDDTVTTKAFSWRIVEGSFTVTVSAGEGGSGGSTFVYRTSQNPQPQQITLPTRTGYRIVGWTPSGYVGDPPEISGTTVTIPARTAGDFTLTPTWEPITYTVAFDGNGAEEGSMEPVDLDYDKEYVVPNCDFKLSDATFQSWTVLSGGRAVTNYTAGVTVSNLTAISSGVLTFRAEWLGHYTVRFRGNGGVAPEGTMTDVTYEENREYALPANQFAKPSFHFTGWSTNGTDISFTDRAVVSNLAERGGICTFIAQWKKISLADAMHCNCTNLEWKSDNTNPEESTAWQVKIGEGFDGSGSCVEQIAEGGLNSRQPLTATFTENGHLSFRWKGAKISVKVGAAAMQFYESTNAWNAFEIDIESCEEVPVKILIRNRDGNLGSAVDIDQMTWTPKSAHPEPKEKDAVMISSAAVSDGKFILSFESDGDFDYNLLTNANLLIKEGWGVMEKKTGTGEPITFEPQIIEGQPQMFYRVDTIQRK